MDKHHQQYTGYSKNQEKNITVKYMIEQKAKRNNNQLSQEIINHQILTNNRISTLSNITVQEFQSYISHLNQRNMNKASTWLDSIKKLKKYIYSNPVLRMHWQFGISQCKITLSGMNGDDVLNLINSACQNSPSFSLHPLVGFPINSIFIEFMQTQNGRSFFSNKQVNMALKDVLDDYNRMLKSEASLEFMNSISPQGWFSSQAISQIDMSEYKCSPEEPHYGFKCWNDWFLRKFKAGARVIGDGSPEGALKQNLIVNSCESTPLLRPLQPQTNVKKTDQFWLKDNAYSLTDMFGPKKQYLALHFEGGTVYQAFLSALFYHRWHSPVDGVIEDIYDIAGTYYLDQSQFLPYDQSSPDMSQSFLSAVATRKVVVIKASNPLIGKIAIIYIGMAEVSSCVANVRIGDFVSQGDEIGHFEFGGSSHAMVFEKKTKLRFNSSLYAEEEGQNKNLKQKLTSFLAEVIHDHSNQSQ